MVTTTGVGIRARGRRRLVATTVAALAALAATGCGSDAEPDRAGPTPGSEPVASPTATTVATPVAVDTPATVAPPPTATAEPTPPAEPTTGAESAHQIDIVVSGGSVTGGGRRGVALGAEVTVRVTSDVADHVHVHGYDLFGDVAAGETVEVVFVADLPGVWEVELEDRGVLLVELEVS